MDKVYSLVDPFPNNSVRILAKWNTYQYLYSSVTQLYFEWMKLDFHNVLQMLCVHINVCYFAYSIFVNYRIINRNFTSSVLQLWLDWNPAISLKNIKSGVKNSLIMYVEISLLFKKYFFLYRWPGQAWLVSTWSRWDIRLINTCLWSTRQEPRWHHCSVSNSTFNFHEFLWIFL